MGGDSESVGRFLREDGDFCAGIDDPSEFVFAPLAFDMEVGKFSGATEGEGVEGQPFVITEWADLTPWGHVGSMGGNPHFSTGEIDKRAQSAERVEAELAIVTAGSGLAIGVGGDHEREGCGRDGSCGERA